MSALALAPLVWGVTGLLFIISARWWATNSGDHDHCAHHHAR